jgi:hypothetical protein
MEDWCKLSDQESKDLQLMPGCGCQDDSLMEALVGMLELCECNEEDGSHWTKLHEYRGGESTVEWKALIQLLDDADLIEHGGNIRCSWRTGTGDRLLEAVKAYQ